MSIFTPTGAGPYGGAYTKVVDGAAKTAASAEVFLEGLAEDLKYTRSGLIPPSTPADYDRNQGVDGTPANVVVTIDGTYYTVFNLTGALKGKAGDLLLLMADFGILGVPAAASVVGAKARLGYNLGAGGVYPAGCYDEIITNAAGSQSAHCSFKAFLSLAADLAAGSLWVEVKGLVGGFSSLAIYPALSLKVLRFSVAQ